MHLSVGRMRFCHQKNTAITDKKIGLVRVFAHDEAPYTSVVGKFQKEIFPDHPADENIDYYIADARGVYVATGDIICVQRSNGTQGEVPWSLKAYLNFSGLKYQSRARLFYVQNIRESAEHNTHVHVPAQIVNC